MVQQRDDGDVVKEVEKAAENQTFLGLHTTLQIGYIANSQDINDNKKKKRKKSTHNKDY